MKVDSIVYRKVAALITEMGYTRRTVADLLGVSYGTLHNKLCAITPFTWEEVLLLVEILDYKGSIEQLLTPCREVYPRLEAMKNGNKNPIPA